MAFDASAVTLLGELTESLREHYFNDNLFEHFGWFGKPINRLFSFEKEMEIEGEYHYWQIEKYKSRPVRTSRDITAGFSNHARFEVAKLRARLSETAANNDFTRFDASARVSLFDLERADKNREQYVVNTTKKLGEDLINHFSESMAIHRLVDESAKIGTVTAVAKQNDSRLYASATATPVSGGTTGIRITLTGMLVAFQPGVLVGIYDGSTSTLRKIGQVTDYNPIDGSVGIKAWNTTTRAPEATNGADIVATTTNDTIFLSGERNLGMISVAEWMAPTVTSPDTFFNQDRALPENSYLRPTSFAATSSGTVPFDTAHMDSLAIALGYVVEQFAVDSAYVMLCPPEIDQAFRNLVGQQNIVILPTTEQAGVLARYGFDGSIYVHPSLGKISLTPNAMAIPERMQLLRPGDWKCLVPRTFKPVPRASAVGNWYDVKSTTDGTATLEYQTDYMGLALDVCERPPLQGQITNISGV
jgi:hypothetical protein